MSNTSVEKPSFHVEDHLFSNPSGPRLCCHSASIFETQSKKLIVTWYAYESEETEAATLVVAQKSIDGRKWGAPKFVFTEPTSSLGNPCLYQEESGRLWLLYVTLKGNYWDSANICGIYSDDDGINWSSSQTICMDKGIMIRHNPIAFDANHALVPAYDESSGETILFKTGDPFSKWQEMYRFKNFPLFQPSLIRIDDQKLLIFFRPKTDPRLIWRSFSTDNGKNWGVPIKTALENPLSGLDITAYDDKVILLYNPTDESRWPLSINYSTNEGLTWRDPVTLEGADFEVSYPAIITGSDGKCHGVFTYNRRKIKYVSFDPEGLWV